MPRPILASGLRTARPTDNSGIVPMPKADCATPTNQERLAVLVFARAPRLGRVKTRLAAAVGPEGALQIHRRLVERAVNEARRVSDVSLEIHYTPADAEHEMRGWLGSGLAYVAQHAGDLGERMRAAFDTAFAAGAERVVLVGSDIPALRADHIDAALDALRTTHVAIGPARDGGYYLIGLGAPLPEVFEGIDWGTDRVLRQTHERLTSCGVAPFLLEQLADLDHARDLPPGWLAELQAPGSIAG